MKEKNARFADRLRRERARLELGQAELWEAGGVSKSTQVCYENGQRVPDLEYIEAVTAVGVDPVFMVTGLSSRTFVARNFDRDLHKEITCAVAEFQADRGISFPPEKQAQLIHFLYQEFSRAGSIEPTKLAQTLQLAA